MRSASVPAFTHAVSVKSESDSEDEDTVERMPKRARVVSRNNNTVAGQGGGRAILGDTYRGTCAWSQSALNTVPGKQVPAILPVATVVPLQGALHADKAVHDVLVGGGWLDADEAAVMMREGRLREGVHLREVDKDRHPAAVLACAYVAAGGRGLAGGAKQHAVFTSISQPKYTLLGFVAGHVVTGTEFEDNVADDVTDLTAGLHAHNLPGSLKSRGGWICDDDAGGNWDEAAERSLVLATSKSCNELALLADYRVDPLNHPDAVATRNARVVNVALVEVRVGNRHPAIAAVTVAAVAPGEELIMDYGETNWRQTKRIVQHAHNISGLNNQLNNQLNNYAELEERTGPIIG